MRYFLGKMWLKIFQKLVLFFSTIQYRFCKMKIYTNDCIVIYTSRLILQNLHGCASRSMERGFPVLKITGLLSTDSEIRSSILFRSLDDFPRWITSARPPFTYFSLPINPLGSRVTQNHLDLISSSSSRAWNEHRCVPYHPSTKFLSTLSNPHWRGEKAPFGPRFDRRRGRPVVVIVFTPDGVIVSDIRHRYTRVVSLVFPTMVRDRIATNRPVFALLGKHSSRFRPR